MQISIISDTHGRTEDIKRFLMTRPAYVIHCGDWADPETLSLFSGVPITGVLGNCDGPIRSYLPPDNMVLKESVAVVETRGRRIAVYHGQDLSVLYALIDGGEYDAVCTGHTHLAEVRKVRRTLVINPGSLAGIRSEKTYAVLETDTFEAEIQTLS